jgi:hypothetical protein
MTVRQLGALQQVASDLGLEPRELVCLQGAHPGALPFYIELRRSLSTEHRTGRPFYLPSKGLAACEFMPGRRDRKYYMVLTAELVRRGLIFRIAPAGNGKPAQYAFPRRYVPRTGATIIPFASHLKKSEVAHA